MSLGAVTDIQNRVDNLFAACRSENRAALILYLTAGFPNRKISQDVLSVISDSGCDLLELGVPFSDPIADGPIIQQSSTVALHEGMSFPGSLELLEGFRKTSDIPVILFGAYNPYLARGLEESAEMARKAGADGILAADLPFDEADEFREILKKKNLHLITLAAPTSSPQRLKSIGERSSGFVYAISMKGTTGQLSGLASSTEGYIKKLHDASSLPVALGFGISEPKHVRAAVDAGADAVVVGSSLVKLIETSNQEGRDVKSEVATYIQSLATELHQK